MKKFKIPIDEQIKMWNSCSVVVEAESAEDIMDSIKKGSFINDYEWQDITLEYRNHDTAETVDWDYSNVILSDIEEIK